MFDKEFYPTPPQLIKKMLEPYKRELVHRDCYALSKMAILEPSAGKGDILDFMVEHVDTRTDMYAIEQDPELCSILRDKGYPVIANDFLTYHENRYWDIIIMNPPFSNGDAHLLHAVELGTNTDIICILNAETIRNPYTERRKQLKAVLERWNAEITFHKEEFTSAERKTDVEIALIRLTTIDESRTFEYDFETEKIPDLDFDFDMESDAVARKDMVGNLTIYNQIVLNLYKDYLRANARYMYFLKNMTGIDDSKYDYEKFHLSNGSDKQKYNYLQSRLKIFMWRKVIDELDIQKYMSAKIMEDFEKFISQQSNVAFTKENVARFFQDIMNNRVMIWENAIVDIFDLLTMYTHENRMGVPGWKTNERFKINRRIILPYWVTWDEGYMSPERLKSVGTKFSLKYSRNKAYTDIDKVLAYIQGHSLPEYARIDFALEQKFNELGEIRTGESFDNTCSSGYFDIKFFKKGTVHLYFKDKELWDKFNYRACAQKNWLPESERREYEKKYGNPFEDSKKENTVEPKKEVPLELPKPKLRQLPKHLQP